MQTCDCGKPADDLYMCRQCAAKADAEAKLYASAIDACLTLGVSSVDGAFDYLSLPRGNSVQAVGTVIVLKYDHKFYAEHRDQIHPKVQRLGGDTRYDAATKKHVIRIDLLNISPFGRG